RRQTHSDLWDADYYILAFVRTSKLKYARADLAAWFTDDQGHLILNSEAHSQPYKPAAAVGPPDAWQVLYIYMPGPAPETAGKGMSLSLQVGILQPQQLGAIGQKNEADDL